MADRLRACNCSILYCSARAVTGSWVGYAHNPIELAQRLDVLIVAVPEAHGAVPVVDRSVLEALGPDGYS